MATRSGKLESFADGTFVITWAGLLNGDDGAAVRAADYSDKTVQVDGVFGAGGSVAIEGSNNNVAWAQLSDHVGTAIDLTADTEIALIAENPLFIRPRVTAGDGTTDLTVLITGAIRGK